ncbi:aromatic-ring-hydroxylating dioxygenase subunit beta [Amycolatopsis rhabdoformis]|uniref:Aromatic-ring-hydroxylating dioxygenase subunit beta n=1 Tax=Amycolatopsis rhabdoformis TaxID=1448059 RepID=A0ABZ1IGE0_9PSEU|nr:aromatic-ring-hydroxylating dioxygenase subunit beta [Amycolatopsis rhabdoformis]WSE33541.1 aromatic-ring-hydroxylating dioxygenase subunit beta [Amycolatopsis rhabdoformis]
MTLRETLAAAKKLPVVLPNTELYGRVAEFQNAEAEILDTYAYLDWIELFTEDVAYRMPVRTTQFLVDGEGFHDFDFIVDDWQTLYTRVKRLETEFAWAETPPSRTRHFLTNLRLTRDPGAGVLFARSNFLITRTRQDLDYQTFTGSRHDELVAHGDTFKIRRRTVLVDQTVITGTNLSIFF